MIPLESELCDVLAASYFRRGSLTDTTVVISYEYVCMSYCSPTTMNFSVAPQNATGGICGLCRDEGVSDFGRTN
jgi:hypothetical protein